MAAPPTVAQLQKQLTTAEGQVEELTGLLLELRREMKLQEADVKRMQQKALELQSSSKREQLNATKARESWEAQTTALQNKVDRLQAELLLKNQQLQAAQQQLRALSTTAPTPPQPAPPAPAPQAPPQPVIAPVFFGLADAQLQQEYFRILQTLRTHLQNQPNAIVRLIGHANADGNETLLYKQSAQRAEALATFLTSRGIARKQIQVVAAGSAHPLKDSNSAEGRRFNRRVEVEILP
jgi:outer membrane protein OmpA-like peptidoglycan-associated protein